MTAIRNRFPHEVREIENIWIPLADGTRLAARIWLPVDAGANAVPAILEYLPYRKNDSTARRDATRHPYFAGHGYASIRVDMRGSGDSDGILYDEYAPQEQEDALEVLAWIAAQPWCTGDVGVIGISWGGFNGLQIAARRPPELKAIITLCSTDDRYADDVHYMGGCVLGIEMLPWASTMLAYNARPPDPRLVGDRWREMWLQRMEQTPPFVETWLAHQPRDAYWKHGSVCEDYSDINCAVYAVGGWADGYSNAIPRLLSGLNCPRKGLIGPWGHNYPHQGRPGPAIGFLQECLRWWDYWLKGIDTGIMEEPMLRAWVQESKRPSPHHAVWPGRWVAEPCWPPPQRTTQLYWLGQEGRLNHEPGSENPVTISGQQATGQDAGIWCPVGDPADFPGDQRAEDGRSVTFTSPPVAEPVTILGSPEATLRLRVDRRVALLAARLCDVAPDGASTLVTRGLLNLTHRDGHGAPQALQPGQPYTIKVRLNAIGYELPAGNRWRLALSPTYWPHAWPSPQPVTMELTAGPTSYLCLPLRTARDDDEVLSPFQPPESAAPLPGESVRPANRDWTVEHDVPAGKWKITDYNDNGCFRFTGHGLTYESIHNDTYTILENAPQSASVSCRRTVKLARKSWQVRIETHSTMTADGQNFYLTNRLEGYEGKVRVFSKSWRRSIPRDLV